MAGSKGKRVKWEMVNRGAKSMIGLFGAGVLALGLSACAASHHNPELLESATYQQGYGDGCRTGNQRVEGFSKTVTRNETLFENDEAYKVGWKDGYGACGQGGADGTRDDYLSDDRFDQGPI